MGVFTEIADALADAASCETLQWSYRPRAPAAERWTLTIGAEEWRGDSGAEVLARACDAFGVDRSRL